MDWRSSGHGWNHRLWGTTFWRASDSIQLDVFFPRFSDFWEEMKHGKNWCHSMDCNRFFVISEALRESWFHDVFGAESMIICFSSCIPFHDFGKVLLYFFSTEPWVCDKGLGIEFSIYFGCSPTQDASHHQDYIYLYITLSGSRIAVSLYFPLASWGVTSRIICSC